MRFRNFTTKTIAAGLALAIGIPAVALAAHPFEDVPDGQWYSDPVDWAFNNGLTTGKTPTTFNGWDPTNRYEVVTFFHRYDSEMIQPALDEIDGELESLDSAKASTAHVADAVDDAVGLQYGLFDSDGSANGVINSGLSGTTLELSSTVSIPEGYVGVIEAEFAAESACYGAFGSCFLEILVDGSSIMVDSEDQVFDSTDSNTATSSSWESHTARATSNTLTAGDYTVTVVVASSNDLVNFYLDDMLLTAQAHITGPSTAILILGDE